MYKKKILAMALGCMLAWGLPAESAATPAHLVQASGQVNSGQAAGAGSLDAGLGGQAQDNKDLPKSPENLEPDWNDPDYVKRQMQQESGQDGQAAQFSIRSASSNTTVSPFTGLTYTHAAQVSGKSVTHGIDVSKWQAAIDWNKVKAAGVKFVFIRCGYTSLSKNFAMYEDEYFRQNIQGAYNAGIKVGIYFFSNSITEAEAKQEAQKTLDLIGPYKNLITLPVVYDFEAFSNSYRAYGLSKAQVTKNMITYNKAVQAAGYRPMYYGSPSFINSSFDVTQLTAYDCWLAHYATQTNYTGKFSYWQYSSKGRVNGINGDVDCNFQYGNGGGAEEPEPTEPVDPPVIVDPDEVVEGLGPVDGLAMADHSTSSISITWDEVEDAAGYEVYRSKSYAGTYKLLDFIEDNTLTEYTDDTVMESEGRQYYYKVVPYIVEGEDEEEQEVKYGEESEILTAHTKRLHSFRLKTSANVNLREQAGTEYPTVAVVPEGTGLPYYKFTLSTADKKWYKVTYTTNGKSYTGYLSGSYVKLYTYGNTSKKVNMRGGAGLSYKVKQAIPKDTKVTILSTAKDSQGIKWSSVKYALNSKGYAGHIPSKYIIRV